MQTVAASGAPLQGSATASPPPPAAATAAAAAPAAPSPSDRDLLCSSKKAALDCFSSLFTFKVEEIRNDGMDRIGKARARGGMCLAETWYGFKREHDDKGLLSVSGPRSKQMQLKHVEGDRY